MRKSRSPKKILVILSLLTLTACSTPKKNITAKPVGVTPTAGYVSTGITELQSIEVRTFKKEENKLKETDNARCELKGRGFTSTVITPGIVNIPVYGKGSPTVTTYCQSAGLAGNGIAEVANIDLENRQASASNAGAAGGLIGAVIASAISSTMKERQGDRFAYKPINVTLSEK